MWPFFAIYDGDGSKILKMASKSPVKETVSGQVKNPENINVVPDIPRHKKIKSNNKHTAYILSNDNGNGGGNGGNRNRPAGEQD